MELKIKTLTPLWTGGVAAGKVDRIHETGILGSLRWWYETIVRGLGGEACDPSAGTCRFDTEQYAKSQATDERQRLREGGLCDVCQVFGATGWRRRFRLNIQDRTHPDNVVSQRIEINHSYTDKGGMTRTRTSTWYFPAEPNNKPKSGQFAIQIQNLVQYFQPEIIAGLIQFISDWGAIGARPQMGFGVIELDKRVDTQPLCEWLAKVAGSKPYPHLPSLRNIFLTRISPKNGKQFSEQDTFNLKYDLRQLFAEQQNSDLRHVIMGTVRGKRIAAKVKMSRPYNNEIRVWGWIPEPANTYRHLWNRDATVGVIHQHLTKNYNLQVWREMNSTRDTATPNNADALAFLQSLLGLEGGR